MYSIILLKSKTHCNQTTLKLEHYITGMQQTQQWQRICRFDVNGTYLLKIKAFETFLNECLTKGYLLNEHLH